MPFPSPSAFAKPHFTRAFLLLLGAWTLFIAGVLGVTEYYSFREERSIALHRAVDSYRKDLVYRRWVSERGGVYVPLNEKTQANPIKLSIPLILSPSFRRTARRSRRTAGG